MNIDGVVASRGRYRLRCSAVARASDVAPFIEADAEAECPRMRWSGRGDSEVLGRLNRIDQRGEIPLIHDRGA